MFRSFNMTGGKNMIEYQFKDVEGNNDSGWSNYGLDAEIEHVWWLYNDVESSMDVGKEVFVDEDTLIIPSYTYTITHENGCKKHFNDCLEDNEGKNFREFAQDGFYETYLKCIVGVHLKEMKSIVQFFEIHVVNHCPSLASNDIKKIYIVKIHVGELSTKDEFSLLFEMKKNITVNDDHAMFRVYEDCISETPGDCPFFANAYEYVNEDSYAIWYDEKKDIPFIAVTDDDITMTYTNRKLPSINYNVLRSKIKEVFRDFQ